MGDALIVEIRTVAVPLPFVAGVIENETHEEEMDRGLKRCRYM